jgi:hypothetical protein
MAYGHAARYRATNVQGHPYHALILEFMPFMTHIGYDPDVTFIGWDIQDTFEGTRFKPGRLAFFLTNHQAFSQKMIALIPGMPAAVQQALMALMAQVINWLAGPLNRDYLWMVAAHRLLARFDAFLVSGVLTSLTSDTPLEEATAKHRVTALGYNDQTGKTRKSGPSNSSNSSGNNTSRKRRRNRNGGGGGGGSNNSSTGGGGGGGGSGGGGGAGRSAGGGGRPPHRPNNNDGGASSGK